MIVSLKFDRSGTFLFQACKGIDGFEELMRRFERRMNTMGRSESTLRNYARHLALIALHFNRLPTDLSQDEVEEYLYMLKCKSKAVSEAIFKHTVFGLRFLFRMEDLNEKRVALPSISRSLKLPVVLSREEVKLLVKAPGLLKHRILIGLLYDCGLRCREARNLELTDIDLDRRMIHVRQGKGKKDRYVPMGKLMAAGIRKYMEEEAPVRWLFNGRGAVPVEACERREFDRVYSQRGLQWAVTQAVKQAGIRKKVSVHTLRHTYATHLLESGTDILTIQKWLGHSRIDTTMVYLHIAHPSERPVSSILDQLYGR